MCSQGLEELSRSREQVRDLKVQVRQLMDELEAKARYMSSSDRIRATYSRNTGSR